MFRQTDVAIGREDGFTLVELLVVMLVVGVLSTLAIPSFLNQRAKGQDSCAKGMVRQMHTTIVTLQADSAAGDFNGATASSLTAVEQTIGDGRCGGGTTVTVGLSGASGACAGTNAGTDSFCVAATSVNGTSFALAQDGSVQPALITRTCSEPGEGLCTGTGSW